MNNAYCLSRRCFKVSNGVVCLSKLNIMETAVNARIQDMRIVTKVSLSEEEVEFECIKRLLVNAYLAVCFI